MNFRRFYAVFVARNKEFLRDRSALAWNILFPVFLVGGFAFAFSGDTVDLYKVGILGAIPTPEELSFVQTDHIQFIPMENQQQALNKVSRHQLDMLIDPQNKKFWINQDAPKGHILERVFHGTQHWGKPGDYSGEQIKGERIRYVDWLLPGVLGMNIMFSALFGVGYVIVRYRMNGVLKRLSATPLTPLEFLSAQIVSRLILILIVTAGVYIGVDVFVNFAMNGSYINLFILTAFGTASLVSLGLIVAARMASEELAGGVLNMISWPMMFLSGVWFSLEGVHPTLKQLALALPLTHLIDGARAIMIDGAGFSDITPQLIALGTMTAIFLLIGAASFKWE